MIPIPPSGYRFGNRGAVTALTMRFIYHRRREFLLFYKATLNFSPLVALEKRRFSEEDTGFANLFCQRPQKRLIKGRQTPRFKLIGSY